MKHEIIMRKRTLLANRNRLENFLMYPISNLNHLPEVINERTFIHEVYSFLLFYAWKEDHPFTVVLPMDEYLFMLKWAKDNEDHIKGDFTNANIRGYGDKRKIRLNKEASGELPATSYITDVYFIIYKYTNRLPQWAYDAIEQLNTERKKGDPIITAGGSLTTYVGYHKLIFKYVETNG